MLTDLLAYFGLFASGFIAATLFPASSELLLITLYHQNYNVVWLWLAATTGNTLGSCVNWYLGKELLRFQHKRWFPVNSLQLARAQYYMQRFGYWGLFFSWLPVVGDPLTLVAGVMRIPFFRFLVLVSAGKAIRYALLLWFAHTVIA